MNKWPTTNQDFSYMVISTEGGTDFARKHYATRPEILDPYLQLRLPILRADLLRYMLLESEGGIYSDLDSFPLHPFSEWVPQQYKGDVNFIVGIEYDQGNQDPYPGMSEPLQFCQWTIASAPGHPIMRAAVTHVVESLKSFARTNGTEIADLNLEDDDVIKVTGPKIWTSVIMETLADLTGEPVDHRNFTGITEPKLLADVLVLPINGFGTGQEHSNSTRIDGYTNPDAMVQHLWKGTWKHNWG